MFESHSTEYQIKPFDWPRLAYIADKRRWAIGRFREFRCFFIENGVIDSARLDKFPRKGRIGSRSDL